MRADFKLDGRNFKTKSADFKVQRPDFCSSEGLIGASVGEDRWINRQTERRKIIPVFYTPGPLPKNKAGYTATLVTCGWDVGGQTGTSAKAY